MALTPGPDTSGLPIHDADGQLLFGVAQEFAWRHRTLPRGEHASPEQSHRCRVSYALHDGDGKLIARIPLEQLQQGLRERRQALRRLLRSAGVTWKPTRAAWYDLQQINQAIKRQQRSFMALTWAISTGKPYPRAPIGRQELLIAVLLLLCFVIPGLLYIALLVRQELRYRGELEQLVKRWRAAGMPGPDDTLLLSLLDQPGARSDS